MNGKPKWPQVAAIIKKIDDEPETVRRIMLAYANTAALNGREKAFAVIDAFRDHWYDCGESGLTVSCRAVCR